MIFMLLSIFVFVCYAVLITSITIGWWRLSVFKNTETMPEVKVSLVVAVRNEALNISALLNSLLAQEYPSQLLEICIVDDHSTDSTCQLVEEIIKQQKNSRNLKLITLNNETSSGKKAALSYGIQQSTGELIVITDADCIAGKYWISTMAAFYRKYRSHMILGPVRMTHGANFSGKLQSLEFISLISSAAGSCNARFPILANGANIAFSRNAYDGCGGFNGNLQFPSGDDMFLMMNIKKQSGSRAIRFLRSEEAIVNTPAANGLKPFIQQRKRWVSKSRGYTDPMLIAASILVFIANGWLVITALCAFFCPELVPLFLVLYTLKLLIDFPLMFSYSRFQGSVSLLWLFPLLELLNSVYTLFIGFAGSIGKYKWKGRIVSVKTGWY